MGHPAVNLDDLTPEEQLQLLEDLWDCLSERPANVPLSDEQRAELDRCLDALEEDIRAGRQVAVPGRGSLTDRLPDADRALTAEPYSSARNG
jgi:putative addiction module component (TIGR02574 family)